MMVEGEKCVKTGVPMVYVGAAGCSLGRAKSGYECRSGMRKECLVGW